MEKLRIFVAYIIHKTTDLNISDTVYQKKILQLSIMGEHILPLKVFY